VAADVAAMGDIGGGGDTVQAVHEIAHGGHHCRTGAGAELGVVLGEHDIADPVQAILDVPVPADHLGELVSPDLNPLITLAQIGALKPAVQLRS
jgi:hypothetical protein